MKPRDALSTLFALKSGVAPQTDIRAVTVGRDDLIRRIQGRLARLERRRRPGFDLAEGDYGEGKSHLLSLVRQEAIRSGFAVSKVTIDFDSAPLHRPKLLLRAVTRDLQLPRHSGIGLEALLRNLATSSDFRGQVNRLYREWIPSRPSIGDDSLSIWPAGLRAVTLAPATTEPIVRWLTGEPVAIVPVRRLIETVCIPPRRMAVTVEALPGVLLGLGNSMELLGYKGLVIILDELENGLSHATTPSRRRTGIGLLGDIGRAKGALYIVGAVTPAVRTTLQQDLASWTMPAWEQDYRFLLRRLQRTEVMSVEELSNRELLHLVRRIRALHESGFGWSADGQFGDEVAKALAALTHSQEMSTRAFVRLVVQLLELCQQYPSLRFTSDISDE